MVAEGASFIDIGAKSTAPYLETQIPLEEEIRRAVWAVKVVKGVLDAIKVAGFIGHFSP